MTVSILLTKRDMMWIQTFANKASIDKKYYISMANTGPNTNGCQFFICCRDLPHLDGKHVVFGKVVEGFDIIDTIELVETDSQDLPKSLVLITNCGEM